MKLLYPLIIFLFIGCENSQYVQNKVKKIVNDVKVKTIGKSVDDCKEECKEAFAIIGLDMSNKVVYNTFNKCVDDCFKKQETETEQERKGISLINNLNTK